MDYHDGIHWDRIKLHCYYDVAIYEGIKECGGYTVFLHLNTTEEKSVGYTVFLHLNEGRKECGVHCFSPGVGKTRNETKQETKQETAPIITTRP